MNNNFVKTWIMCVFASATAYGNLPEDPSDYMQWESDSLAAVKAQLGNDPEIAIPKLGGWLAKLSTGMNFETGDRPVFCAAQKALLSIPGHAKYYQDKIDKMRAELLANTKKTPEELLRMHNEGHEVIDDTTYLSETEKSIRTLRYMPSSETVSVLGYFLNDPVGRDGKSLLGKTLKRGDSGPYLSNAELSTDTIRDLGIEQPPFRDNKSVITPEEIDAWKDWWNEIKGGKRTYRFIGSKVEYGADGPATPELIEKAHTIRERDEKRAAGHTRRTNNEADSEKASETKERSSTLSILIAAAVAVLVSIAWYVRRRKSV